MRAVSNTSPISNLAAIGRLSLLQSQFTELWIPPAVSHELAAHPDPVARTKIRKAISEQWIKVVGPATSSFLKILLLHLHSGESQAIALAAESEADVVLIDEQEGRRFAVQAGLLVTGVLGILLRAKKTGSIPALRPEIQSLRKNARFFIAPSLEASVLAAAGE